MRNVLVRISRTLALAASAAVASTALSAQDIPGGDSPFGVREAEVPIIIPPPPPPAPDAMVAGSKPAPPVYQVQFIPTALAGNGLNTYGANVGLVTDALFARKITVRGGYRRIDLADADSRNRWMGEARIPVTRRATRYGTTATLTGEYMRTTVAGTKYKLGTAVDQLLWGPIAVGVTGFYVGDDDAEDVGVSTSATYVISKESTLQVSYRFANDVETERDYSLTLNQFLFRASNKVETRLIVGAARDRTVWATLSFAR